MKGGQQWGWTTSHLHDPGIQQEPQFFSEAQCRYVHHYCRVLGEALDLEQDGEVVIDMDAVADAAGKEGEKPSFYVSEQSQQRKFTCGTCEEFNDILGGCPRKPQMSSR